MTTVPPAGGDCGAVYRPAGVIVPSLALQVIPGVSFITSAESWMLVPAIMLAGAPATATTGCAMLPSARKSTGPWLNVCHDDSGISSVRPPVTLSTLPVPPSGVTAALKLSCAEPSPNGSAASQYFVPLTTGT